MALHDVRPAAVAGMFYPGARPRLAADVRAYVAGAMITPGVPPKAVIVPHAGYVYSGPVAACAYRRLAPLRDTVRRVVLLGPTHRVPVRGLAVPDAHAFATPLGDVPIDREAVQRALRMPQVAASDAAHAREHALEVQLPFLQTVLGGFSLHEPPSALTRSGATRARERPFALVPFAVGDASAEEVAGVLDLLWGGAETLVVVSSDLSHYHRYDVARQLDRVTADTILALSPTLDHEQACGATPVNGLLLCAKRRKLGAELLDLRNSGDTAGDRARVVGYAAFAFSDASTA